MTYMISDGIIGLTREELVFRAKIRIMLGYSLDISQRLAETSGDSSVFQIIWDRVNLGGSITINQLLEMVRQLDLVLELNGFLLGDEIVKERAESVSFNEGLLDKLQTFDLLVDILQDIKIIDMDQGKLYGTWNDSHELYIDDSQTIIKRNQRDSIYDNLDTLMQESKYLIEDDFTDSDDDMMSLIGFSHKRTLSSPSTIQEATFSEPKKFSIKESIDSLEQLHNTLYAKFNTIDLNLRQITLQNSNDRNNLLDLSFKNEQMIEKIDLIKLQTKSIAIKLNLLKLNLDNPHISNSLLSPDSVSLGSSSAITSPMSPLLDKSVDFINVDDVSFDIINDTFEDLHPRILSPPSIDSFVEKEILEELQLANIPSNKSNQSLDDFQLVKSSSKRSNQSLEDLHSVMLPKQSDSQDDSKSINKTTDEPKINQPPSKGPSNSNTDLIKPRSFALQSITALIIFLSYIASYFYNAGS